MPVFNAYDYVGQAMDSIFAQNFQDWELIVINDGSTDASLSVIQDRARADARIKVISRENRGLIYSLNEGVDLANGRWVARMDADDISRPQRFSRQLQALSAAEAQVCGTAFRTFGAVWPTIRRHEQSDQALKIQLLFDTCFAHPSIMMDSVSAKKYRYDEQAKFIEDYDLWVRMALAGVRFCNVKEVLLDYRIHAAQVTAKYKSQQVDSRIRIAQRYQTQSGLGGEIEQVHAMLLSRGLELPVNELISCVNALRRLSGASGNPEGVVERNVVQFLGRHSRVAWSVMAALLRGSELTLFQKAMLLGMSALGPAQGGVLMAWLKKFR